MDFSTKQSEPNCLTDELVKFTETIDNYSIGIIDKKFFLSELNRLRIIDWKKEILFNQLMGYYALGNAYRILKTKELDYRNAYYVDVNVYNEISYYHNFQYVVCRIKNEKIISLFNLIYNLYPRICLNLANAYDHLGRFCEAQQLYLQASNEINIRDEVELNLGFSYANTYSFFEYEKPWVVKHAKDLFSLHPQLVDSYFPSLRASINSLPTPKFNMPDADFLVMKNSDYEKWVNMNYLRLNRYCDVNNKSVLSIEDNVRIQNVCFENAKKIKNFYTYYETIFYTFIKTRYLMYEAIKIYNDFNIEKLKMVYTSFYSLFDKIAMMICVYLNLPIKPYEIDFAKMWTEKRSKAIRPEILSQKSNLSLLALYNLKLDVYGSKIHNYVIDDRTKDLQRIRNFIEHKFIEIEDGPMIYDDYQLTISKQDLEQNTIRLAQLVRCAIIYLCNFIMHAEYDNEH